MKIEKVAFVQERHKKQRWGSRRMRPTQLVIHISVLAFKAFVQEAKAGLLATSFVKILNFQ